MAYGVIHFFSNGTKAQYDATVGAVHPPKGLPAGQIFHAAGASAGGWTVVAVHSSKASWEAFRDGVLLPKMQAGVQGGFTLPPQETVFEAHHIEQAALANAR